MKKPSELHAKVAQHEISISNIEANVAQGIVETKENFKEVFLRFDKMALASRPDTRWMVMALIGGIAVLFTGFKVLLTLTVTPLSQVQLAQREKLLETRRAQSAEVALQAFRNGQAEADSWWVKQSLDRINHRIDRVEAE